MTEPIYLEHLKGAIPEEAFGYTVSSYCVALEGWRRGLTLKFINQNRRKSELIYSLSDGEKEHVFSVARGDLVPREAINICVNKAKTKDALIKANVPTPMGTVIDDDAKDEDYIKYAKEIGYPVVAKPVDGTGGSGVITGIKSDEELINAIQYIKNDLNYSKIIIEKYIEGNDYRLYVIGNRVIAAFTRDRANVIGDGKSTIRELVNKKNELRASNPALKGKSKINLNHEAKILLKEKGLDFNSIPKMGEKVYLNTKNNVSSGGDPTDATDFLNEDMKQIAVNAAKAIPGLVQCGVDMIIDSEQKYGYVLEINSRPHIRSHLFPMQGQARDIPKEIIDFYFPNTKGRRAPNIMYFDFDLMYKSFRKGYCSEYTIPQHPTGETGLKRYEISNLTNKKDFERKFKKKAKSLKLSGHMKGLKNGKVSIVIAGEKENIQKFEKHLFNENPSLLIEEKIRNTPVKVGFEVINMKESGDEKKVVNVNSHDPNVDGYFPVKLDLGSKSKKTVNKSNKKESKTKEIDYKKEYEKLLNSTSWKITKPLRAIGKVLKKMNKVREL